MDFSDEAHEAAVTELDLATVSRIGGMLAECVRNTREAEHKSVGMRPVMNRHLARLVCPPVANSHQMEVPRWAYLMGPVDGEVVVLRRPGFQPEVGRWRLLRGSVSEAWHRWASPAHPTLQKIELLPQPFYWTLFPQTMRVSVALWVKGPRTRSLLVEYERPASFGGVGVFRLPGEFVEADRDVHQHGYRVLAELHQWEGHHPEHYTWCWPSDEGMATLRIDRRVETLSLNPGLERDSRRFLLTAGMWRHIKAGKFGVLRTLVEMVERTVPKPRFTVANDVLEALRDVPKE